MARDIELPRTALSQLPNILENELTRTTPLSATDVVWDFSVQKANKKNVNATQLVARKAEVEGVVGLFAKMEKQVKAVRIEGCDGARDLPDFRADTPLTYRLWRLANVTILVGAMGLASLGIYTHTDRQSTILQESEIRIQELEDQAIAQRDMIAERQTLLSADTDAQALSATKTDFLQILADITERAPNAVWLTEMVFHGNGATLRGLTSSSAADFVIDLAASDHLENPRLNGPVSTQQGQTGERFEIAVDLVRPKP